MQNLPPLPDVYTTNHITCVSCKERFAITEGHQANDPQDRQWRVLSHEANRIRLRQEDNRQQRPVFPQPLQIPAEAESTHQAQFLRQPPVEFTPFPVNCPRCGADNRNWMILQERGKQRIFRLWRERFPNAIFALAIAILFAILAISTIQLELHWLQVTALVICIPVSVFLLIQELTSKWNHLREGKHIAKVKEDAPDIERQLWIRGFSWVVLASFALPLLFFFLLPKVGLAALEFVSPDPKNEVETAAATAEKAVNQDLDDAAANIEEIGKDMDALLEDVSTAASPQFEEEVNTFSEKLSQIITAALNEINVVRHETPEIVAARRDQELETITKARIEALEEFTNQTLGDFPFFLVWGFLLGLPLSLAVFFVMNSIKQFVAFADSQLPPPIFHSVASMTRIVGWEAKQALEIEGTMHHIQWVNVERNEHGGINLTGLHRDPPSFDAEGRAFGETVRAQKHVVVTDMWGRIIKATIHDVRVPRPAGGPDFILTIPQPHDAPVSVRQPTR